MKISKPRMALKILRLWLWTIFKRGWHLPEIPEITVDELNDRLNSIKPPLLLDLRDQVEFYGNGQHKFEQYGHIPNSKWIRFFELASHLEELQEFKDREIVTICPGGGMSLIAAEIMINDDFQDVKSLRGGIKQWHKKEYPLIKTTEKELPVEEIKLGSYEGSKTIEEISPLDDEYSGEVHYTVDARNFSCPIPVLRSKKQLQILKIGQVLEILTTDPGSQRDIPAWARATGQELLVSQEHHPNEYRFLVKRMN